MSFYVELPSNESTNLFPENNQSSYTIQLKEAINLNGQYEVALVQFNYDTKIKSPIQTEILIKLKNVRNEPWNSPYITLKWTPDLYLNLTEAQIQENFKHKFCELVNEDHVNNLLQINPKTRTQQDIFKTNNDLRTKYFQNYISGYTKTMYIFQRVEQSIYLPNSIQKANDAVKYFFAAFGVAPENIDSKYLLDPNAPRLYLKIYHHPVASDFNHPNIILLKRCGFMMFDNSNFMTNPNDIIVNNQVWIGVVPGEFLTYVSKLVNDTPVTFWNYMYEPEELLNITKNRYFNYQMLVNNVDKVFEVYQNTEFISNFSIINPKSPFYAYIYTNIIEDQRVGDTVAPCIKTAIIKQSESSVYETLFDDPHYVKLNKSEIKNIHIEIRDTAGNPIDFENTEGITKIKLHFRKLKQ